MIAKMITIFNIERKIIMDKEYPYISKLRKHFKDNQKEFEKQLKIVEEKYPLVSIFIKMKDKIIKDNLTEEELGSLPENVISIDFDYHFCKAFFEKFTKLYMFNACLKDCRDRYSGGKQLDMCKLECIRIALGEEDILDHPT